MMRPTVDPDPQAARIGLLVTVSVIVLSFSIVPPLARQWRMSHPQRQEHAP